MDNTGKEPENIAVTPSARAYLERFEELALLEGEPGQQEIMAEAQPLIEALHHVLGGGKVSVTIDSPGDGAVVEDLNTVLGLVKDEWNKRPIGSGKVFF